MRVQPTSMSTKPPFHCSKHVRVQAQLEKEKAACTSIAARTPAVKLVFDRVLLADSGTLLLVWKNPCGTVWRLRDDCSEAFPGASMQALVGILSAIMTRKAYNIRICTARCAWRYELAACRAHLQGRER